MSTTEQEVTFAANGESLSGRFIRPTDSKHDSPQILFLHGAGRATKERSMPLASRLAQEFGLSSFGFDFSGHGASTGTLENSSLAKRTQEAKAAIQFADFSKELMVCGFSMGAHIALELLKSEPVTNLVLFYPGVYATAAFEKRFGDPDFSSIIRGERSWESTSVLERLRTFPGNLLIVVGENDQVVPPEVFAMIYENATSANSRRTIVIPGAPHLVLSSLFANSELYAEVCRSMASFVMESTESMHMPVTANERGR